MLMNAIGNPEPDTVEGMTPIKFAEHVRRQTGRIIATITAGQYVAADVLASALLADAAAWKHNLGADVVGSAPYCVEDTNDWLGRPDWSE